MTANRNELQVARVMEKKGYKYVAQLIDGHGEIGDPLYLKSASDLGPVLRKDYPAARIKWSRSVEQFIKEREATHG